MWWTFLVVMGGWQKKNDTKIHGFSETKDRLGRSDLRCCGCCRRNLEPRHVLLPPSPTPSLSFPPTHDKQTTHATAGLRQCKVFLSLMSWISALCDKEKNKRQERNTWDNLFLLLPKMGGPKPHSICLGQKVGKHFIAFLLVVFLAKKRKRERKKQPIINPGCLEWL